MKVWIDLYAAPDSFFFRPIRERLHALGHETFVTSRDYNETVDAARHCGFDVTIIGRHGGNRLCDQMKCGCNRIFQLANYARKCSPDVAVSFNSYSQAAASKILGMRFVTFMDYEYHPLNHVAFRLADDVIVPAGYDEAILSTQVRKGGRVHRFDGLKENISVTAFSPNKGNRAILGLLDVGSSDILVTMRPPPEHSSYHRFDNDLFYKLLPFVAAQPKVKIVYLPRSSSQRERADAKQFDNVITPEVFVDGFQLIHCSDLVISAGGSMNREAVALGTPAYTTFMGQMAGVDRALIKAGLLAEINSTDDFKNIAVEKCGKTRRVDGKSALVDRFTEIICGSLQCY